MGRLAFIKQTWRTSQYLLAGAFAFVVMIVGILFRNIDALMGIYAATGSLTKTVSFAATLVGGITTAVSPFGAVTLALFGILLGANIVLLIQYIRRKRNQTICIDFAGPNHGATISGTIASIFGIGCAACGSAILFGLLNIFGASGLLLLLPLEGGEFSLLGLMLLSYATWRLLGIMNASQPGAQQKR